MGRKPKRKQPDLVDDALALARRHGVPLTIEERGEEESSILLFSPEPTIEVTAMAQEFLRLRGLLRRALHLIADEPPAVTVEERASLLADIYRSLENDEEA